MTVQLEPGKLYQRGDGKVGKCRLVSYPFKIDFGDYTYVYTTDGKYNAHSDYPTFDIVREVTPEPWRVTETGEYTMRNGEPMWVDAILEKPDAEGSQIVGHWLNNGLVSTRTWTIDGRYDDNPHDYDIMPPCVDAKCETPAKTVIDGPGEYVTESGARATVSGKTDMGWIGVTHPGKDNGSDQAWSDNGVSKFRATCWNIVGRWKDPIPPKSRPWSRPEDVPPRCLVRWIGGKCEGREDDKELGDWLITGKTPTNILFNGYGHSWKACQHLEYSVDGREWRKCEVAE